MVAIRTAATTSTAATSSTAVTSIADAREYADARINPTLKRGLVALCQERPDCPVEWLAHWLLSNRPPPDVRPTISLESFEEVFGDEAKHSFRKIDVDGNGFITEEEWRTHFNAVNEEGIVYADFSTLFKGLAASSRRIIFNLLGFLRCKEAVEQTALAVLPGNYMERYSSFSVDKKLLQHACGDGSPMTGGFDALVKHCGAVMSTFVTLVTGIVRAAGLSPSAVALHKNKPLGFTALTIAPLKSRVRCDEKATNEYNGEHARIIDCVRCSIVVDTEEQLMSVAKALSEVRGVRSKK